MKHLLTLSTLFLGIWLWPGEITAQVFGQNKPRYRSFDFKVMETPHFLIHYYSKNPETIRRMADWSEHWYNMHSVTFNEEFTEKNPIIFYNDHADFQQTNAISGEIGVGTGGVTEGFKNRVVMPFTMINSQTQHVLGHELVHAFQYKNILGGDSTSLESLANIPLWMIEGMAEYLSLGRVEPFTAMWMRDAVLNDDVPNIKKLSTSYKYFPYRYGHAFWSFFGGMYGDHMIVPLLNNTAKYGLDVALEITLGTNQEDLGAAFTETLKTYYTPYLGDDMKENFIAKKIVSDENAGDLNVSPVLSPDGKYVIFLSNKNLFSTDLYLADAREGKIIKKINSILRDSHVDDFNLLESSGTWSPNSRLFAYVVFAKGRNMIVIKDVLKGSNEDQIKIPNVASIAHPNWSPDGNEIAFTGMVDGQTDLFIYNLKSKKVTQLTDDFYSEVYPDYSPDGKYIVFSSDRQSFEKERTHGYWNLHLSRINLEDMTIEDYDHIFPDANNINPCYDPEGNIYFVSDRDGFRNLYRYDFGDELLQMTDLVTGITGISKYSPAISVSKSVDRIAFTHYYKSSYDIYQSKADRFLFRPVSPDAVDFTAGTLPIALDDHHQIVTNQLESMDQTEPHVSDAYKPTTYNGKFKLDYVYSGGLGVSTGGIGTRTGLAGGVGMIFSDLLGNHQLSTTLAINGEFIDIGAAVQYINQKSRVAWGLSASHIPLQTGFYGRPFQDTLDDGYPVFIQEENILRIFEEQLSALFHLPFSKSLRLEGNLGINYRSFRLDVRELYYDLNGNYIGEGDRERVPLPDEIVVGGFEVRKTIFYSNNIALVGDKSRFGLASPIDGYRYRFDITNYFGGYNFQIATADMRFYHYRRPFTFAFRFMHYATLGQDANSYYPILIGDMGLVHGFEYGRLGEIQANYGIQPEQLIGSKFFLTGLEIRLPFTGPGEIALIQTGMLFSELAAFIDGGVAFNEYEELTGENPDPLVLEPKVVFSAGFSGRFNLFGAMVLEPYFAWPLLRNSQGRFGLFIVPGW